MLRTTILVSMLFVTCALHAATTFQQTLSGKRLVLVGQQCAGWQFKDASTVLRFDEIACSHGGEATLQARIRWLTSDQFLLVESSKQSANAGSPPRVWHFKIAKLSADRVTFKTLWLGWGDGKDSTESYRIEK